MTGSEVIRVGRLPSKPLEAAALFHGEYVEQIRAAFAKASSLVVELEPADHTHDAWRLAAIQELAREAAPARVNAIAGGDRDACRETREFLSRSPGITGQILTLDGKSPEKA